MTEPREYRGRADARSGALLHLRLLETTDLHGHVMPFDYHSGQDDRPLGLARLATLIRQARRESANCLLFDNGDFLQGTPLSDMTGQPEGWDGPNPVIAAMNALDYDAVGLGNHEFNFGLPALGHALEQARFPAICTNVRALGATSLPFASTLILERRLTDTAGQAHDLRIGVIALVPPQITTWDRRHLQGRLQSTGITETARRLVPDLRAAGADLVIALAHTGIDDGPDHPGLENAALPLSRVPGIDAVLAGHSHRLFPGPDHEGLPGVSAAHGSLNGIPAIMAGFAGSHLGLLDLVLMHDPEGWRAIDHRATLRALHPGTGAPPTPADPAVVKTVAGAHRATMRLINRPLGTTAAPLHSYLALVRDDPALRLVNAAQTSALARAVAGTPDSALPILSATAPFRTGGRAGPHHFTDIPAGPVRLRNVADLYAFPNTLVGARITGAALRDWLERAASCFHRLLPGIADQPLADPVSPGHAFDVISGVTYRIDLSRPPRFAPDGERLNPASHRVRDLRHQGRPVARDDQFLIATNEYRAAGGGPYRALPEADILHLSMTPVRDLLAHHIRDGPAPLRLPAAPGWAFYPMPPGTSAIVKTGPGLRNHPGDINALDATDLGDTSGGFMRLRMPLGPGSPATRA